MKKQKENRLQILRRGVAASLLGALLYAAPPAEAASYINLGLSDSHYMSTQQDISRLAVGDPAVATIVQLQPSRKEFLIVAHKAGSTTLFVWTADGMRQEFVINVSPEDRGSAQLIEAAIGLPRVHVKKVDNRILLTGIVKNQYERNYAIQTAQLFVGGSNSNLNLGVGSNANMELQTRSTSTKDGKISGGATVGGNTLQESGSIIDLLQMEHPTQVRMEAQVIAINPSDAKQLGIRYGGTDSTVSNPGTFYAGESHGDGDDGAAFRHNPWRWLTDRHNDINLAISALVTQSKAKILSRPNVTTMSGESATIQVGGQIPYTTRDSNGSPNTQFKDYGIILQLKPVVDAENRIVASVHAEVSNLSGQTVDDQPILDVRSAESVVTVRSGSTMVIGGLMDSSDIKTYQKVPLLGDIPILGEFFKYSSSTKEKQELLILITSYLVNEDEAATARMSDSLHEFYQSGQREKSEMREVDLNEQPPNPEVAKEEAARKLAGTGDSILGKYLNREVLPDSRR